MRNASPSLDAATWRTPRFLRKQIFFAEPALHSTWAPKRLAAEMAAKPTPPAPAWINTTSPQVTWAPQNARFTVKVTVGKADASKMGTFRGLKAESCGFWRDSDAWAPMPKISSGPDAAKSWPPKGAGILWPATQLGMIPRRCTKSKKFRDKAFTRYSRYDPKCDMCDIALASGFMWNCIPVIPVVCLSCHAWHAWDTLLQSSCSVASSFGAFSECMW